ncbi:MAG: hypothetical protein ACE14V_12500, partial [bacterium]
VYNKFLTSDTVQLAGRRFIPIFFLGKVDNLAWKIGGYTGVEPELVRPIRVQLQWQIIIE